MGIRDTKQGKLIYHLTRLSNLDSILEYGLLPRKAIIEEKLAFSDVANHEIISKRTELGLDIYTPFHFHPYSSFDVVVKNTYAKKVKMAECLTELAVPVGCFHCICVKDDETKKLVEKKLKENGITEKPPYVDVMPWI